MTKTLPARTGLSLDRLRSFVLVADSGGYARAAPNDPSRQSQLCRQVGELEHFFGQELLERRSGKLATTEAGQRLATLARHTFHELEDLAGASAGSAQAVHLQLGAGDSVLHWWVLPRIAAALARLPNVTVSFTSLSAADIVRRLDDGSLDLGIVRARALPRGREVKTQALLTVEYAMFASRALLTQHGARTVDEVVARVPLAVQHSEPSLNECLLPFAPGGAIPSALGCETFPQACRAVRSGSYAALLPVIAREELPRKDYAELTRAGFEKLAAKLVLAWHPRLARQRRGGEIVAALGRGLEG